MDFIVPSSVLVPLTVSIINFRFLNKAFKVLCYYFVTSLTINIITTVLAYHHISNLFFFHIYTPIEAVFLFLFFQNVFAGKKMVIIIRGLMILFPVFCLINFMFFQNENVFNTYTHPVEALLFIGLAMYYFFRQNANDESVSTWTSFPLNWVISGLLLYFSSTFFLYVFSNVLISNYSTATNIFIWNIHGAIVIITNLLWATGLYKCRK